MSEISNIGINTSYAATRISTGAGSPGGSRISDDGLGETDPVEFSRLGRMLADIPEPSSLRLAKIQALRQQIADGTFETPERIDGTVDRLLKELQ